MRGRGLERWHSVRRGLGAWRPRRRAQGADVLPGRPRVDAAQDFAGVSVSPVLPFPLRVVSRAPRSSRGLRGIRCSGSILLVYGRPGPSRGVAEDRTTTRIRRRSPSLPIGPALRVGMKHKLVKFPAEWTAPTGYGDYDEGDEVLKCFDETGTLPCLICGVGIRKPGKACGRPRSFSLHLPLAGSGGKLPWRRMLRYSGKLGKKAERITGGEHPRRPGSSFSARDHRGSPGPDCHHHRVANPSRSMVRCHR